MTAQRFSAPWSTRLSAITAVGTAALLGSAYGLVDNGLWVGGLALVALWLACLAGHVRGYSVEGQRLHIDRLAYGHVIDLSTLQSATVAPGLFRGALRVGNGGLFSFSGWFLSRSHGWFRAVATDSRERCVLLTFESGRWAVSPDDPLGFVDTVRRAAGLDE